MASTDTQYDSDCGLMLHMDGADTSTTFTDSSFSDTKTVTANGNAQIDTAQSLFGGASCLLDGAGDYLSIPDSDDWAFGSGDFTIDFWYRLNVTGSTGAFYSQRVDANNTLQIYRNGGETYFYCISAGSILAYYSKTIALSAGTWQHHAFVRSGTSLYYFVDGVDQSWTTITAISTNSLPNLATSLYIGFNQIGSDYLDGWMEEFRVVKGTAVWTANFTPPASAYTQVGSGAVTISRMMLMGVS